MRTGDRRPRHPTARGAGSVCLVSSAGGLEGFVHSDSLGALTRALRVNCAVTMSDLASTTETQQQALK